MLRILAAHCLAPYRFGAGDWRGLMGVPGTLPAETPPWTAGSGAVAGFWNQCPANEYCPGQGIRPHTDEPTVFEGPILSLSLLSDTVMVLGAFPRPVQCKALRLPRRSLLILSGAAVSSAWQHGISARRADAYRVLPPGTPPRDASGLPDPARPRHWPSHLFSVPRGRRISLTYRRARVDRLGRPAPTADPVARYVEALHRTRDGLAQLQARRRPPPRPQTGHAAPTPPTDGPDAVHPPS